ncbi:MAG: hypothetical protein ABI442_06690 [Gemmatimonadaceae bacterium]
MIYYSKIRECEIMSLGESLFDQLRAFRAVAFAVAATAIATACSGSDTAPAGGAPTSIAIVSGNGQVGLIGTPLSVPLVVRVTSNGTTVSGAAVTFAATSGAASVSPASATTDGTGQAKTTVTFGATSGNVAVSATVQGTSLSLSFIETAATSSLTQACASGSPLSPAAGAVIPGISGTGVCLSGGTTGAEYALVAFHGNEDATSIVALNIQSHGGATGVATAALAPSFDEAAALSYARYHVNAVQQQFEATLRANARRELAPLMSSARAIVNSRPSFTAIPASPAIGALFTLNANGNPGQSCTNAINVTARVAAVSNLAIVVADTANPAGGFTDAEYASFAATFDTLISPLDIANFGQPTDIDKNGKTIIFFTKEVNKLTPRGSGGVIGGFFHERDLFPTATDNITGLQGCATSNFAEMYYSLVPDQTAKYGDARSKAGVQGLTPGTLVHEFQHLINAGRRLYVNDANDFEEVWLNEGLSHIAEELLYYHVAKQPTRQNLGISIIAADTASANIWNTYQSDNSGRFQVFLSKPAATSVYADNDSLETRGATWNLLRYLADHRGSSDGDAWQQLDNAKTVGQQNLATVFAGDGKISTLLLQIRDWATSIFADDVPGMNDAKYADLSWNMRNIFPRLVSNGTALARYPLAVLPLSDAQPVNTTVFAGGAAYIRFFVPAGASASIDWSSSGLPVSPLVQFTVVRSK